MKQNMKAKLSISALAALTVINGTQAQLRVGTEHQVSSRFPSPFWARHSRDGGRSPESAVVAGPWSSKLLPVKDVSLEAAADRL
jgi:hypothetical protein